MGKSWSVGDGARRCYTGELRGYLSTAFRGMQGRDWMGTPRQVALRFIRSYQEHSSAGQHRCGRGAGRSCSTLGYRYVDRYGAIQGAMLTAWVIVSCGTVECYDNPDVGNCCGKP